MIPSVGRIVHVRGYQGRCIAAIITEVAELPGPGDTLYRVGLTAFPAHGPTTETVRRLAPAADPRAWHDPRECPPTT